MGKAMAGLGSAAKDSEDVAAANSYNLSRIADVAGIPELKAAWSILYESPRKLLLIILYDFLFLFSFGFIVQSLLSRMSEYVVAIGYYVSQNSGALAKKRIESDSIFSLISSTPELSGKFYSLIVIACLAIVALYLIWILFEGLSWRESQREKAPMNSFLKGFAAVSIPFMAAFVVVEIFSFVTFYLSVVAERAGLPFPVTAYYGFIFFLFILIFYFLFISYALLPRPATSAFFGAFRLGIMRMFILIPKLAILGIEFVIIIVIFNLLLNLSEFAAIAIGIILLMPFIALSKAALCLIVGNSR